jgi:hypothetical protein
VEKANDPKDLFRRSDKEHLSQVEPPEKTLKNEKQNPKKTVKLGLAKP